MRGVCFRQKRGKSAAPTVEVLFDPQLLPPPSPLLAMPYMYGFSFLFVFFALNFSCVSPKMIFTLKQSRRLLEKTLRLCFVSVIRIPF